MYEWMEVILHPVMISILISILIMRFTPSCPFHYSNGGKDVMKSGLRL